MNTFRAYLNEELNENWFKKQWNKLKNAASEPGKVGDTFFTWQKEDYKSTMPQDVLTITKVSIDEDEIKYKNLKGKEFTVTFKGWLEDMKCSKTDWIDEKKGSGMKAFEFFELLKKKDVIVTLPKGAYIEFKGTSGKSKIQDAEMKINVKRTSFNGAFHKCKGFDLDSGFGLTFSPFEMKSFN